MRTLQLLLLALVVCVVPGMAQHKTEIQHQNLVKDQRLLLFGEGEADSSAYIDLVNRFYMDQYRHAQDPRAPYFLMMSRNGKMAMGIGGMVKGIASYDWDGSISGDGFAPYKIPIPVDPAQITAFQTTIGHSALFFSVFGADSRFGNYQMYIEASFNGTGSRYFKLKKAYAIVGDWTVGYTKSTFVDPKSQPMTVETQGPNSEVNGTRILLRYAHDLPYKLSMALSLETPLNTIPSAAGLYEPGSDYMPNVAAALQYGTVHQHVRLSGMFKGMRYRNLKSQQNGYVPGWGLNLTTVLRPGSMLTVYGAANIGYGIGSMVNDLGCGVNDLVGRGLDSGRMYAPLSYGWYGAVQVNFRPDIYSSVILSQERIKPKEGSFYTGSMYRDGWYATANIFYELTPRCIMGAEVNVGKRCNINGESRNGYRAGLMAQFSF